MSELQINLKSQELVKDENGYNTWRSVNEQKSLPAPETALRTLGLAVTLLALGWLVSRL